jgi:SAM-dependent methyltransferase
MSDSQTNPYIFGDPLVDRQRLETASQIYGQHIRSHAHAYLGAAVKSILDVGCGEGQLGVALLDAYPGAQLVGIDRDAAALEKARQNAATHDLPATYIQGDIQDSLPAGSYDVALCFTVLEHVPHYRQALSNIVNALTPGGRMWIQDIASTGCFAGYPNRDFQRAADLYIKAMTKLGNNMLIMDEMPALLAECGLQDIKVYAIDYPVGGFTAPGQNMLANILGGLFSARQFLSKMTAVPEREIGELMEGIADDATINPQPGYLRAVNVVARKPEG